MFTAFFIKPQQLPRAPHPEDFVLSFDKQSISLMPLRSFTALVLASLCSIVIPTGLVRFFEAGWHCISSTLRLSVRAVGTAENI